MAPEPSGIEALQPIRVFIVSEVRLHREGIATLLQGYPTIQVLGAGGLQDAVLALRTTTADVALLDVMQSADPAVVGLLRQVQPSLRILAIGIPEVASEVLACATAGIDGYIWTDAGPGNLVVAIESLLRDELLCSPKVAATLYHSAAAAGARRTAEAEPLTKRELQVVQLMSDGLSNKDIAQRLGIEACTAKNHVQNIMQKLQVHRRGQAVAKLSALVRQIF